MGAAKSFDPLDLIGGIYDAAAEPSLWQGVIVRLGDAFAASQATLVRQSTPLRPPAMVSVGFDPEATERYLAHFYGVDPITRAVAALPAGTVTTDRMIVPREEMLRSEFYNDFLAPMDVETTIGVTLARGAVSLLGMSRTLRGGDWLASDVAQLRRLAPHIRRALDISRRLDEAELGRSGEPVALLGQLPQAVMLLDRNGRIKFANAAAERLIAEADGIAYARGRLVAATPALSAELAAAIARAAAGRVGGAGDTLVLPRPSRRPPMIALLAPASPAIAWRLGGRPGVILLLAEARPANAELPAIGQARGDPALAPRERDCLRGVAAGRSSKMIAGDLGLSPRTIDKYIDSAMRKLGAASRAEAVMKAYGLGLIA